MLFVLTTLLDFLAGMYSICCCFITLYTCAKCNPFKRPTGRVIGNLYVDVLSTHIHRYETVCSIQKYVYLCTVERFALYFTHTCTYIYAK